MRIQEHLLYFIRMINCQAEFTFTHKRIDINIKIHVISSIQGGNHEDFIVRAE